ncbi:MAG: hypothetical protein J7M25_11060 [Deltaproteobacteria bacterium]|nr:hypothetical protein [Deltaproteobacteria bacterium]
MITARIIQRTQRLETRPMQDSLGQQSVVVPRRKLLALYPGSQYNRIMIEAGREARSTNAEIQSNPLRPLATIVGCRT